jgi:hypothetical protein
MFAGDDHTPPPAATTTWGENRRKGTSGRFGTYMWVSKRVLKREPTAIHPRSSVHESSWTYSTR